MITLPHTIHLKKPFAFGSTNIESITVDKEPDAGDLADILNTSQPGDRMLRMIVACCTDLPEPAVKKLKIVDVLVVTETITPFFGDGLEIGV